MPRFFLLAWGRECIVGPSLTLLKGRELIVGPSLTLPKGREFVHVVFKEVVVGSFPLGKAGMGLHFATAVTMSAGSYLMIREFVPYVT